MKRFSIFLLFGFIFLLFCHRILSFDMWWHLKTGQYILQNFKIPQTDLYSYVSEGKPWMDMQWLFQVMLAFVYQYFGVNGLCLLNALLALSFFLIIFKTVSGRGEHLFAVAAIFLAALCMWERSSLRPELITYLYMSIFIYILHRYKYAGSGYNKKYIYLLPLVQLFWVNSHALFILGMALIYAYVLGEYLSARIKLPVFNDTAYRIEGADYRRLVAVAVLITAVSFLSPYTYRGFLFPFKLFTRIDGSVKIFSAIGELPIGEILSPFSSYWQNSTVFFYKSMVIFSFLTILINLRRFPWSQLIVYLIFFGLSSPARRNIPEFALVCVPIIVENMRQATGGRVKNFLARDNVRLAGTFVTALVIMLGIIDLAGGGVGIRGDNERNISFGLAPFKYPDGAVSFVERSGIKGNIYNDLQTGNYLIWRFYPKRKIFFDGRLEVHDEELYREYVRLIEDPGLFWPKIAKKYNINYVLLAHTEEGIDGLLTYLFSDPGWKPVYFDDMSVIFVKDSQENQKIIKKYQINMVSADFADISRLRGLPAKFLSRLYFRRGNFFTRFSNFDKAKQNYTKAVIYDPLDENSYIGLGMVYSMQNDFLSARESYKNALNINLHSSLASLRLGELYYRHGDIDLAVKFYRDAINFGGGLDGAYLRMAQVCSAYIQYEQAEKWYLLFLRSRPWNIRARVELGVVYAQQGLDGKARQEFLKVLKADPDNSAAIKNIAKLDAG